MIDNFFKKVKKHVKKGKKSTATQLTRKKQVNHLDLPFNSGLHKNKFFLASNLHSQVSNMSSDIDFIRFKI